MTSRPSGAAPSPPAGSTEVRVDPAADARLGEGAEVVTAAPGGAARAEVALPVLLAEG